MSYYQQQRQHQRERDRERHHSSLTSQNQQQYRNNQHHQQQYLQQQYPPQNSSPHNHQRRGTSRQHSANETGRSQLLSGMTMTTPNHHPNTYRQHYNEDLVQMIAKIRSLQDELLNQRFRCESLQSRLIQSEKTIDNLQYDLTSMQYEIDKYKHQVELSNQKNVEIMKYEENLKIIGEQIEQLNEVLIKKNRDYDNLVGDNSQLEFGIRKLQEEAHLLKHSLGVCRNQLGGLIEELLPVVEEAIAVTGCQGMGVVTSGAANGTAKQALSLSKNLQQAQKHKVSSSVSQDQQLNTSTFNEQINMCFDQIREIVSLMEATSKARAHQCDLQIKQTTADLLQSKEAFIKLEYQHKLLQQRTKDSNRQQELLKACYNERKVEEIIEEMLTKQDQLVKRIRQLTEQNELLKQQLQTLEQNQSFSDKVQKVEQLSIIDSLRKQNSMLENTISQLQHKIQAIQASYNQVIQHKEMDSNRQFESDLVMMKKLRKIEEENLEYKVRIQQLMGEVSLLNKEVDILRANQFEEQNNSGYDGYRYRDEGGERDTDRDMDVDRERDRDEHRQGKSE